MEEERCWRACCDLGFFYLDLREEVHGETLLEDAGRLFAVMRDLFLLPVGEKERFDFAEKGSYFGYKGCGRGIVDERGTRDGCEFYNVGGVYLYVFLGRNRKVIAHPCQISKDDILRLVSQIPCPDLLNHHRPLFETYIRASHSLCMLITSLLSSRLSLNANLKDAGDLSTLHALDTPSGDQIRFVRAPPQSPTKTAVAMGEHTDFGSVTILFNRLGGLQVKLPHGIEPVAPPSSGQLDGCENALTSGGWAYVKPLPGHCVVNLGDALVKFSGGRLRSNIHRVVPPPGEQARCERYSLVYFCRPRNEVLLRSLIEGEGEQEGEGVTAEDWILRRALGRRRADGWKDSVGTEGVSMRAGM